MKPCLLKYYGDDFTGSTDVMEALALNGVPTALFLKAPDPAVLESRFSHLRAMGVAGMTRSLPPGELDAVLSTELKALRDIPGELFHYKVCSTFDSSPETGSIGQAMETGIRETGAEVVPILVGAPRLKRYVVFGQLFATVDNETHRIDRHPTMSRHPVTPMQEADLRRHLAAQTRLPIQLADVHAIGRGAEAISALMGSASNNGAPFGLLCDTLDNAHLATLGAWIWENRARVGRFIVGSSGLEWALAAAWRKAGVIPEEPQIPSCGEVSHLLVLAGSAAPQTARQIKTALEHGYGDLRLELPALLDPDRGPALRAALLDKAEDLLRQNRSVVLYATLGPDDPVLARTREFARQAGTSPAGELVSGLQADLLQELLSRVEPPRICVAGGDTSGRACQALGIEALELAAPLSPGAPLCHVHARAGTRAPWTLVLKGGQIGSPDFFESVRLGCAE